MITAGITLRVRQASDRPEREDTLDQAWEGFLAAAGIDMVMLPNHLEDPVAYAEARGVRALILTGGNNLAGSGHDVGGNDETSFPLRDDLAPERDRTERLLLAESTRAGWPVIGVCRGMQMVNVFHGGSLTVLPGHVRAEHRLSEVDAAALDPLWTGLPRLVNSFHQYALRKEDLAPDVVACFTAEDHTVEAFRHIELPHAGLMWHPERPPGPRKGEMSFFRGWLSGKRGLPQ